MFLTPSLSSKKKFKKVEKLLVVRLKIVHLTDNSINLWNGSPEDFKTYVELNNLRLQVM